jgi:hypothetical protein
MAFICRVDAQTKAFRDYIAKHFDNLSVDERRELNVLIVKVGKNEAATSDKRRYLQLFEKIGLVGVAGSAKFDKTGGFARMKESVLDLWIEAIRDDVTENTN